MITLAKPSNYKIKVVSYHMIFSLMLAQASISQPDSIRANYVKEFTKLSLWYVHKRLCESDNDFEDIINTRVNIYRNTLLYDWKRHPSVEDVGPEWRAILAQLKEIFNRYRNNKSTEQLEEECLSLLCPHLRKHSSSSSRENRPYECWSYDYRGNRVNLHIYNVYQPKSPLSEMYIPFAASLIQLLRDTQRERSDIEIVHCGSWLNSMPPFQALFPEQWKRNGRLVSEVRYTMGYWGQFTDRHGDFHARNGVLLRETGEFPFPNLSCECSIEKVLSHLEANFPEAIEYNAQQEYI